MPSDVWKFYTKQPGNILVCNLCGNKYKNCGNTTNLRNHLKSKYQHAFIACMQDKTTKKTSKEKNVEPTPYSLDTSCSRSRSRSPLIPLSQHSCALSFQGSDEDNNLSSLSEHTVTETASTSTVVTSYNRPDTPQSTKNIYDIFKDQRSYADGGSREAAITQSLLYMILYDSIPEFSEIRDKVKALVTYFKRSNVAMDYLRAEQRKEGRTEGTFLYPIQDILTRWNSTFHALQRFVIISGHIGKILLTSKHKNAPPMLSPAEVDVISNCIAVLKPFEEATKELSGEKYITASMVIPIVNCIRGQLHVNPANSQIAMQLKRQSQERMNHRMADLEKVDLLEFATILDPRCRKLHFQSAVNAANAISSISREVCRELNILDGALSSSSNDELPVDPTHLWSIHDKEAAKNTPETPSPNDHTIPHELKLYLQQPFQPRHSSPMTFWHDSRNAFPGTYRVAVKYLTVLGNSVPSERTVSRLNYVASDNRARLSSAHTDMLVFLGSLDNKFWFS